MKPDEENNHFLSIIINIATSGKYTERNDFTLSDSPFRYVLMNFFSILGFFSMLFFSISDFINEFIINALISFFMSLVCLGIFILARTKVRQIIPFLILELLIGLSIILYVWSGESGETIILYIFIYPLLAIILMGMKMGIFLSLLLLCTVTIQMFVPGIANYEYRVNLVISMIVSYLLILSAMVVIEITRQTKDQMVKTQKKTLEKQAAELQDFNDNLQTMVDEKTKRVIDLQNSLLKTIAELVEWRDDITGGHIERTQKGLKIMLEEIERRGLNREVTIDWNLELLLQSCQLHDVGKISISDSILKKPEKLTFEEFEDMKKHTIFGKQIIERIEAHTMENDFLNYAKIFAVSHHEKWDGTGYPNGLKENKIPLLGRIMAIIDVYDALTSVRPYKDAYTHEKAVQIITEGSGTQFDPVLVEVFICTAEQFKNPPVTQSLRKTSA